MIPQAEFERRVGRRVVRIAMHLDKRSHVEKGDFVISMRSFQGGLERAWASGAIRSSYVVLRPARELDLGYFAHLFKAQPYIQALQATGNFIRDGQDLTFGNFSRVGLPFPPLEEQIAIGRFLDHTNRRLDRGIRAKKKVIALLNEQKQAIIQRAVTRGLDPSVPMKDSGVPWLREIPAHWDILRAKYLFREVDDRSVDGRETHLAMSQRLGLVPSSQVASTLRSESYAGGKLCREGDLVLNRLKAHLGVFATAHEPGVISPDYTVFRNTRTINVTYFESVLRSAGCRRELRTRAKGIVEGFWRLYTDDFYDIRLPVPPPLEQDAIVASMLEQTSSLSTAVARATCQIELLREYSTRLVADVVTGKLDVRAAATGLLAADDAELRAGAAPDSDEALDEEDAVA